MSRPLRFQNSRIESVTMSQENDPKEDGPKPPFTGQEGKDQVAPPGHEQQMTPQADHGEKDYVGAGKLKGKVALITGADSGIGRAVALAFAREGADVVISYLNEHDDARETERLVTEAGQRALVIPGDIGEEAHCQGLVSQTVAQMGKLDVLVNNAAFQKTAEDISEITEEILLRTYRTNVFAQFFLCKAALAEGVMKPGGSIINTCSVQAYKPSPQLLTYASTKGAVVNFTKGLAQLAIKKGIRVNSVAPGPVWTPLIPSTMPKEEAETFGQDTPLGRPAQPKELAPVYVLLASDAAACILGATYAVTNGEITT